jgi:hypothetical protein
LNNYPPQLPPPQPPGGYNPFNPYQGYDPNADYIPWLPGRQGPRFIPIALIVGAILICSCCSFLIGTIFGIELPAILSPTSASPPNENPPGEDVPPDEGGFHWQVVYPTS